MNYLFWILSIAGAVFFIILLSDFNFKIKQKERIKNLEDHQRFFNKQHKKWWEK